MDFLETFRAGCAILDDVMNAQGFFLIKGPSGNSSGGNFASGEFVKADRRLAVHLRNSLGLVTYHVGSLSIKHEAYMRALLGPDGGNRYPGFSTDRLDGFRNLAYDLAHFCGDFLNGSGEEFKRCVINAKEREKIVGYRALPS
jgi:hypothetical protein